MSEFMATFGVRYRTEQHPSGLPVDPDGYVLILADDYDEAVDLMQSEYGQAYAFIYPDTNFKPEYHPKGVIRVLDGITPHVEPAPEGKVSQE